MPEPTPPLDLDAIEAQDCNLAHMCDCHDHIPALLARVRALEAEVGMLQEELRWAVGSTAAMASIVDNLGQDTEAAYRAAGQAIAEYEALPGPGHWRGNAEP